MQQATPNEADKIIFKHCFNLQHATNEIKKQFIADNCVNPEHEKYFIEYLKLADYKIKYDEQLIIDTYRFGSFARNIDYRQTQQSCFKSRDRERKNNGIC